MCKNHFDQRIFIVALLLCMTQISFATDGYFSLGYGTKSKGMGGAGVAMYSTSLIGGNPAGHVFLGKEFAVGIGLFSPDRQYSISGNPTGAPYFGLTPGTVTSDNKVFFIPSIGGNWMLNKNSALGFSIYGNGGMNTSYPTKTFDNPLAPVTQPTGVNISQLFTEVTYSIKIAENHGLGISAIGAYQMFEAKGLQAFASMSEDPQHLTNKGTSNSIGYGIKIGYLGKITDNLSFGAKYQSKIFMSRFKNYAGLFAQKGDFDVPSNWTAGLAYKSSEKLTLAFDVKQIRYTDIKSVSNPISTVNPLGADNGSGFGWKDMMIYKVGAEYAACADWTWRAGYSYGTQPIPSGQMMFNILAPGVSQNHITAGFTRKLSPKGNAINFALMYSPAASVSGKNNMDPNQNIKLKMSQFDIELGYTF
jgi:long-chain fatty acid transport protein